MTLAWHEKMKVHAPGEVRSMGLCGTASRDVLIKTTDELGGVTCKRCKERLKHLFGKGTATMGETKKQIEGLPRFTRGPRIVEDREERIVVWADRYHDELASFRIGETETTEQFEACHAEQLANAHLDAAAPDLYDALVGLLELADEWAAYGAEKPPIDAARKALAKARGET